MSDNIIIPPLTEEMRCGIFTNAKGEILIIHDKDMPSDVEWIEYNTIEDQFSLIHHDGQTQDLGIKFDTKIKQNLLHGTEVTLALMLDKKIVSSHKAVFVIKEY